MTIFLSRNLWMRHSSVSHVQFPTWQRMLKPSYMAMGAFLVVLSWGIFNRVLKTQWNELERMKKIRD